MSLADSLLLAGCVALWLLLASIAAAPALARPAWADGRSVALHMVFLGVLVVALPMWRWHSLWYANEISGDESQVIAQALRCRIDPLPWRGFVGGSGGPLNTWVLLWSPAFGLTPSFQTARITSLATLFVMLAALSLHARDVAGDRFGLLCTMPAVTLLLTTLSMNFLPFTSEQVPAAIMALAAWQTRRAVCDPSWPRWLFVGVLYGLLPFSKLQVAPLAALAIMAATVWLMPGRPGASAGPRCLAGFTAGWAGAVAAILGPVWAGGAIEDFAVFYLRYGGSYGAGAAFNRSPWELLLFGTPSFTAFFLPVVAVSVVAIAFAIGQAWRSGASTATSTPFAECGVVALYVLVTGYLTTCTGTGFAHYLMLLVGPLTLLLASALAIWRPANPRPEGHLEGPRIAAMDPRQWGISIVLAIQLVSFAREAVHKPRLLADWGAADDPIAAEVRALARPGDRLHVWDKVPRFYVSTTLSPVTRFVSSDRASAAIAITTLAYRRLMEDLERDPPEIFLDATAALAGFRTPSGPFVPTRADYHFGMPAMDEFVRTNYTLQAELAFAEDGPPFLIYLRNDCVGRPPAIPAAAAR